MRSLGLTNSGSLIRGHLHTFKADTIASTILTMRVPPIPGQHEGLSTGDEGWQNREGALGPPSTSLITNLALL